MMNTKKMVLDFQYFMEDGELEKLEAIKFEYIKEFFSKKSEI